MPRLAASDPVAPILRMMRSWFEMPRLAVVMPFSASRMAPSLQAERAPTAQRLVAHHRARAVPLCPKARPTRCDMFPPKIRKHFGATKAHQP